MQPGSLSRYLRWRVRRRAPGQRLHRLPLRELWGMGALSPRSEPLVRVLELARELGVKPGWVRVGGDSQRIQLFGREGRQVVQCLREDAGDCAREQAVRRSVGMLAPRIFQRSSSGRGWAEEWIAGPSIPAGRGLRLAFKALCERLYRPRELSREEALERLRRRGLDDEQRHLLERIGTLLPRRLPFSQVHGDLWPGNMITRDGGESGLVLLDWEYTRQAPLSYDVWCYTMQWHILRPQDPQGLCWDFARALRSVGLIELVIHGGPLACLHMLDKLTWVRDLPGSRRTTEVEHLGRWLRSLSGHVFRQRTVGS